jgi:FixJ family two-component response regulator
MPCCCYLRFVTHSKPFVSVVDDDEGVRRAFERLARSAGFETATFSSGEAFLAAIATREPDCVVLDLHMPAVDGLEVQSRMAKAGFHIPVIVVTAYDSPEARDQAMAAGAGAFLRKPVDDQALLDAIQWALAGNRRPS